MKSLTAMAKAFSDPNRVRLLSVLRGGELCVCELSDALGMSQSTLSTHLQVLRTAGLAVARKSGKWSYYSIASGREKVVAFLFEFFDGEIARDRTLSRDGRRMKDRLALREGGACCVGFSCGGSREERSGC